MISYLQIMNKFDIVIGLQGVTLGYNADLYLLWPTCLTHFDPLFAQCTASVDPFPLPPLWNDLSDMTIQYKVEVGNEL